MPSKLNIGSEIKYKGSQCNDSPSPLVKLDRDLDPDLYPDPDPHSEKLLDPDPHKMNADPQP